MPLDGDLRKQILLDIRANGEGVADRAAVEVENLKRRLAQLHDEFGRGTTNQKEFSAGFRELNSELGFWTKTLTDAKGAATAADPEFQRLQATLGAMNDRVKQDAAEAIVLSRQSTMDAVSAWREKVAAAQQGERDLAEVHERLRQMNERDRQDAAEASSLSKQPTMGAMSAWRQKVEDAQQAEQDLAAVHERLRQMDQRDRQDAAEALDLSRKSTREAVKNIQEREQETRLMNELIAEQAQAERDLAAVHEKLRQMDLRSHNEGADAAAQQAALRAQMDANQAAREGAELQAKLGEMEKRSAEEGGAARDAWAASLNRGKAALQGFAAETQEAAAANQQAVDTFNKLVGVTVLDAAAVKKDEEAIRARNAAMADAIMGVRAATTSQSSYVASTDQGTQASGKLGYSILNLAHGLQDLQYGFGAVLNNIPLIVGGLGVNGGLAGALMTAGVAVNVFGPSMREVTDFLGMTTDASAMATGSLGQLKEKLTALEGKSYKVNFDYTQIKDTKMMIDDLEERLAAYESTKKTTGEEYAKELGTAAAKKVSSKKIADVLRRQDEQDGIDRATDQTQEEMRYVSDSLTKARARYDSGDALTRSMLTPIIAKAETKLSKLEQQADEQRETYYKGVAGGFAAGTPKYVSQVRDFDRTHSDAFTREESKAIGTVPYTKEMAEELAAQNDPAKKRREELDVKKQEESAKEAERLRKALHKQADDNRDAAQREREQERKHEVGVTASAFGGPKGMEKPLVGLAFDTMAAGGSEQDVAEMLWIKIKESLDEGGIRKKGDPKFQNEVANQILETILRKAQAEAVGQVAERAADGVPVNLQEAAQELAGEAGAKEDAKAEAAKGKVAAKQKKMSRAAMERQRMAIAQGMQQDYGLTDEQAMGIAPEVQANMKKGMNAAQAGQAAMIRLQQFFAHQNQTMTEVQANQEAMMGVIGPAIQALQQQKARNGRIRGMINQVGGGMRMPMMGPFPRG